VALHHGPLTERLLPRGPWRWAGIVGWSALPFVRILVFGLLGAAAGLAPDVGTLVNSHMSGAILNAYVIAVALLGTGILAKQLETLGALGGGEAARWTRHNRSIVVPLVLAVGLTFLNGASQVQEFGTQAVSGAPQVFGIDFLLTLLFRIPQATALYSTAIALLAVAELGRHPPPGTFPEDRSLGLGAVGELLTTVLFGYVAIFIPVLLFGTSGNVLAPRVGEFLLIVGVLALGLAAILVAAWSMHRRLVAERARQVGAARARYAVAYRGALAGSEQGAGTALETARLLLEGAESIHEWPFNDRTLRVVGLLLTGVITGIVLRVAILTLGI
jgi:hypothetical protein